MINVLWLAPNFNHYKARFLNHLAKSSSIDLTILSGTGRQGMGDQELEGQWDFKHIKVTANKKDFGNSKEVRILLKRQFSKFDWVLIPAEKKNILLFFYAKYLQLFHKQTKIFSYNHPLLKSGNGKITFIDKLVTKFYYRYYDRIIFYTKKSYDWAVDHHYIKGTKASWANNTIDNEAILAHYKFSLPPKETKTIVFIGRLIPSKSIAVLLSYFEKIQITKPTKPFKLEIIGDGPESYHIKKALLTNKDIIWHGTLIDELNIAPIMKRASLVFVPGLSGLSINHAFMYGRPYVTLKSDKHGPEIDYLENGLNGYLLEGNFETNSNTIKDLLFNRNELERFCNNAKQKGDYLSVQKWVEQMKHNLLDD